MEPLVIAVNKSAERGIAKEPQGSIELIAGHGVLGDVHAGTTVKHRSRAAKFPDMPNLRQVHLIHAELHDELVEKGFTVTPGLLGENITTRGLDLLALPRGTKLHLGEEAVVEVTGLRNPCAQLDGLQAGLMQANLDHAPNGDLIRKTGVMSIVLKGGEVCPGDGIRVELPDGVPEALIPV